MGGVHLRLEAVAEPSPHAALERLCGGRGVVGVLRAPFHFRVASPQLCETLCRHRELLRRVREQVREEGVPAEVEKRRGLRAVEEGPERQEPRETHLPVSWNAHG